VDVDGWQHSVKAGVGCIPVNSVTHGGTKVSESDDFQERELPVCLSLNGELDVGVYAIYKVKILNCLGI
jgi:hypothetical protein